MKSRRLSDVVVGLAVLGCAITGTASVVIALLPLLSGEFLAAGVCLAAAGLSFGLIANALLRE